MNDHAGRVIDARLHLLDRQLVDRDGRLCGNVDDLELSDGERPHVVAILCGPAALAERTGGLARRWLLAVHARLHGSEQPGPARIPFTLVSALESDVRLSADREDLPSTVLERWARDTVISKIPGATDAPD